MSDRTAMTIVSENIDARKILRQPYFVPENKKLDSLMHAFKKGRQHLAIVIDEHGGVSGLITLEDALEEIVGEITDETDRVEPRIIKVKGDEWIVPGKSDIEDVNEKIPSCWAHEWPSTLILFSSDVMY